MSEPGICPNKENLVSYLYGEGDAGERALVEQHAASCTRCSLEIVELGAVRQKLVAWTPPEVDLGFRVVRETPAPRPWWAWARVPALVQAAAVVLLLAGAVAVANLEVRYGPEGFVVRTGWSGPALPEQSAPSSPAQIEAPWRAELASLERQLRDEFSARQVTEPRPQAMAASQPGEAEMMRRLRLLLEESERRQRQEMAFRMAGLARDFELQRRSDLVRIEQGFGQIEGRTGAAVAEQRELMMKYLVRTASGQR